VRDSSTGLEEANYYVMTAKERAKCQELRIASGI